MRAQPPNAEVLWNAASFFECLNPDLCLQYLEATVADDPNHPFAPRPLANLFALFVLEGSPLRAHSGAALAASKNA